MFSTMCLLRTHTLKQMSTQISSTKLRPSLSSVNDRLSLMSPTPSVSTTRSYYSRDVDPVTEKQRAAIERFRRSRDYTETYTNLTPGDRWLKSYRQAMSAVKPLNFIKDTPWTLENMVAITKRVKRQMEIRNQGYDDIRYSVLGHDIGAAHFIVYRRGAVKFYGQENWIRWTTESKYSEVPGLPFQKLDGYSVEAVDMSNVELHYEGLENFRALHRIKYLSLAGNKHVDDWFLDVISNFSFLETLDLRNCPGITHRGMAVLYKLDHLKSLLMKNEKQEPSDEMKLAVLNLLDFRPDLQVDIDPTETEQSHAIES